MIGIVDYGMGNLFSVHNSLNYIGAANSIICTTEELRRADALLLPGVGAYPDAMRRLTDSGLADVLRQEAAKKPLLGVCLGMQLLFERGYEFGETAGLGLIPGSVVKLAANGLKLPHMGWNELRIATPSPLTEGLSDGDCVYFVHSYRADTEREYICCDTDYGQAIPALVRSGNAYGAQFHPEKSSEVGLTILKNFARLV